MHFPNWRLSYDYIKIVGSFDMDQRTAFRKFSVFISCIGVFLSFIPNIMRFEIAFPNGADMTTLPIRNALNSGQVHDALIASIAISALLFIELWLDLFSNSLSNSRRGYKSRIARVLGLVVPNIIILTIITENDHNIQYLPSILCSQLTIFTYAFTFYLHEFGSPIWTPRVCLWLSFLFTCGLVFGSFSAFQSSMTLPVIAVLFLSIGILLYVGVTAVWFFHIYYQSMLPGITILL